jgi:hypothetical protein
VQSYREGIVRFCPIAMLFKKEIKEIKELEELKELKPIALTTENKTFGFNS